MDFPKVSPELGSVKNDVSVQTHHRPAQECNPWRLQPIALLCPRAKRATDIDRGILSLMCRSLSLSWEQGRSYMISTGIRPARVPNVTRTCFGFGISSRSGIDCSQTSHFRAPAPGRQTLTRPSFDVKHQPPKTESTCLATKGNACDEGAEVWWISSVLGRAVEIPVALLSASERAAQNTRAVTALETAGRCPVSPPHCRTLCAFEVDAENLSA